MSVRASYNDSQVMKQFNDSDESLMDGERKAPSSASLAGSTLQRDLLSRFDREGLIRSKAKYAFITFGLYQQDTSFSTSIADPCTTRRFAVCHHGVQSRFRLYAISWCDCKETKTLCRYCFSSVRIYECAMLSFQQCNE